MLDLREEIKDFKPVDLNALSSEDTLYTESMRIAFTLYNKALKEIHEGYRDLAKNNLRKAVSHYPEFGDAMIVLAICTFVNGDRIGAVRLFNAIKKPEDRKRGMEVLEHLANAPDYIPPRSQTPIEERTVRPPYDRPVFGKYSTPGTREAAGTAQTKYVPAEIRPASMNNEDSQNRTRSANAQRVERRQEVMRGKEAAPVSSAESRPTAQSDKKAVLPTPKSTDLKEEIPKESAAPESRALTRNRVLAILFVLLAAFAIFAAAAWMHTSAQNRQLREQLEAKETHAVSGQITWPMAD